MRAKRYQAGSLAKEKTKLGLCWYLRFTEDDGTRPRIRVGLLADYPTKTQAQRAATDLRKTFNAVGSTTAPKRTFGELVERYLREEIPSRYSTAKSYRSYLQTHILPKWKNEPIELVRAQAVRTWLKTLPLSPKTQGHVRDLMRNLFRFAMLWEWIPISENPMTLFRIDRSSTRTRTPIILSPEQFHRLLEKIPQEPYRTIVIVIAALGLGCSEGFALQWQDINFIDRTIRIKRAIVDGRVGACKTEYRDKDLPLHEKVVAVLLAQYCRTEFKEKTDWIFASPFAAGEKPYHTYGVQRTFLKPAAKELGLGSLGWHSLRHSYRAWLSATDAPMGVQKDLMRHADIRTTMNIYGGSFNEDLRKANDGVIGVILQ